MSKPLHDIERLIERSSVDDADGVPMPVRRLAFASVARHPNYAEALLHPFCSAIIFFDAKSFFERSNWPQETKTLILDRLQDVENVLLLSIMTSDEIPTRNFTGGGGTYDFALHPKTYQILHAALGTWRT